MAHDARAVANHMLELAWERGKLLTPMQLLKLVYIAHGCHLGLTGEPLIKEPVEAWRYGPVIPSVYHTFKKFGFMPITEPAKEKKSRFSSSPAEVTSNFTEYENRVMENVFKEYSDLDGFQLSYITHREGTPWYKIWEYSNGKTRKGAAIPNRLIQSYYQELINADENTK